MNKSSIQKKLNILILEDNPRDAEILMYELHKTGIQYSCAVVSTKEEYVQKLDSTIDIILSDYSMPQFDAPQALILLQERSLDIPFIVISGTVGEETAVSIMRAGATDYLMKDRLFRLGKAIENAIQLKGLRRQSVSTAETLKKMMRAIEQSADSIVITDSNGVIEYVNPGFSKITGYTVEDVIGKTPAVLKSGKHDERFYSVLWNTIKGGRVFRAEFVNRKKNGDLYTEVQAISPVFDDSGVIINFVSTGKDITERKRAEDAIRHSEQQYRTLIEAMNEGVLQVDNDDVILFANDQYCKMVGYTREELMGKVAHELLLLEEDGNFIKSKNRMRTEGFADSYEIRIKTKSGEVRWVKISGSPIYDVSGTVIGSIGIHSDITEQKKAVEALKLFRALIDGTNDAVEVIDPVTGRFLDMNERECIDLGYSREEMLQMSVFDVDPNVRRENFEKETAAEREAGTMIIESVHRRKDGSVFPVEVTINYIKLDKEYIVAIVRDITERKQIERRNKLIANLGYQLSSVETSKQAAKIVVDVADQLFGWDACTVDLYFEHTGLVTTVLNIDTVQGERVEFPPSFINCPPTDRMRRVIKEGSLLVLRDLKEGFGTDAIAFGDTSRPSASLMFVPIRSGDMAIGILSIQSYSPNKYNQSDIVVLQGMADQCGAAFIRIRALEDLRKSEANLRRAQQIGKVGSIHFDIKNNIFEWSDEVFRMFGKDPKTFVPTFDTIMDMIHPDEKETMLAEYAQFLKSRNRFEVETNIVVSDGTVKNIAVLAEVVRDEIGTPVEIYSVLQDITERKHAEKALKASESKYKDIFTFAPVGIYQSTTDGKFITVNATLVRMLGYKSEEELLRKDLSQDIYFDGQERDRLIRMYEPKGTGTEIEIRWKKKNGTPIWIQLTSHAIKNAKGETLFFEGFVRDITEQKKFEDALKQSEERYRTLIDSAVDAIFTISKDGVLTSLNPAFEKITGWKRSEWLGKSFTDLIHEEDRKEFVENFKLRMQGKEVPVHEYHILTSSHTVVVIELLTALQYANDEIVGMLGVARDVTERKKLEEQIRQGQKMESIGTLAGGIAHDFNNILGIILASATMLERLDPSHKNFKSTLETINKTVQRGAMLVRQILTFARQNEVKITSVQINDIVVELTKMLEMTIPKTIGIKLSLDASLPNINVDSNQVHQALLNLCVNARDAILDRRSKGMQSGTITISTTKIDRIRLKEQFQHHNAEHYIVLRVSDTGIGMDGETIRRIFDPFFTTKEIGKGTGLGLAVVYGVMQSLQGFVDVESVPGEGTTFSLYFPISDTSPTEQRSLPELQTEAPGGSETVLVIEDEESLAELVKFMLEAKGYTVLTAANGAEGVETFKEHADKISLVFTDFGLPEMDGFTMLRRIKEIKPDTRMLMASGYLESSQRSEIFQLGVYEIIQKPYEPSKIVSKIREMLDQKNSD
ncbi:MAG: PAS domain S-box protein [Bacteroidota bacterium]